LPHFGRRFGGVGIAESVVVDRGEEHVDLGSNLFVRAVVQVEEKSSAGNDAYKKQKTAS
jgi:hypothetical protein